MHVERIEQKRDKKKKKKKIKRKRIEAKMQVLSPSHDTLRYIARRRTQRQQYRYGVRSSTYIRTA